MIPSRRLRQALAGAAVTLVAILITAAPAAADPAGPTDYRTDIIEIEAEYALLDRLEVEMIGGDSFIALTAAPGTTIEVIGYAGEPYLRFEPDGTVVRNERSPSRWLNDDRYGDATLPPEADGDADPDWRRVADGGSYAWHDHRTHWMNPQRPPGAQPGDTVLEAAVPVTVDGAEVLIHVRSVLLDEPSPLPAMAGALAATALVFLAAHRLGTWGLAVVAVAGAGAGLSVGIVDYLSVPPETGPSLLLWAFPLIAVAVGVAGLFLGRARPDHPAWLVLVAFAGGELAWWTWTRRDVFDHALLPTDVPAGLERAVIAAVGVAGVAAVAGATRRLLRT